MRVKRDANSSPRRRPAGRAEMACSPLRCHPFQFSRRVPAALGSTGGRAFRRSPLERQSSRGSLMKQVTPKMIAAPQPQVDPLHIAVSVIDALPEPAILLSRDGSILASNSKAGDLFGGLRPGFHISSATRSPQVLDAVMECGAEKAQRTVTFSERVPVERYMAATVSTLKGYPKTSRSPCSFCGI